MNCLSYEKEYIFFKNLAERYQIPVHEMKQSSVEFISRQELSFLIAENAEENEKLFRIMEQCPEKKMVYMQNQEEDSNGLFFLLPEKREKTLLFLGPFSTNDFTKAYGLMAELSETIWGESCELKKYNFSMKRMHPLIENVIDSIEKDIKKDHSLRNVAKAMNVSPGHLSKLFRQETGITLTEYVNKKKIAYGAFLLKTTNDKVTSIAAMCGIKDNNYFSRLFKKYIGMSPAEYRETNGAGKQKD